MPKGSALITDAGVTLSLLQPLPHRGLGQIKVLRDLTNRPVTALAQLDDLGLDSRANV
jgi:hypothetical protein